MAVRKYRKRPTRRVRRVRRTLRTTRRRLPQGKVYAFKRTCQMLPHYWDGAGWSQYALNQISTSVAAPSNSGIFKFRLEDVPSATDFTQMFEQFKITGVKLRFIPYLGTESSAYAAPRTETLAYAIDRGANDLAVVNPSFNEIIANQDMHLRNSQRPFSIYIGTPTFHQPADGLAQGAYKSGWLDSDIVSARNVDFHGLKWAWNGQTTAELATTMKVFATYYIKCRNPQ